jgi:hypothetical protein
MRERPRRRDAVDVAVPRRYQSTQAKDKKDKKDKGDKKDKKSKKVLTQCHERDAVFMQTSTRRRAASTASTRPHVAATPSPRSRESPRASRTYRGSSATA